jgi:hypothetical protein
MLVLNATTNRLWAIAYIVVLALGIFAQVYRYRRISTPLQKQQTKWAVFGFAIALGGFLMLIGTGLWLVQLLPPFLRGHALSQLIIQPLYYLFVLIIPLFIGLAILRSRLWEIDVLINRTLVYGLLTAILLGTYLLLVFGGQYLLASLLGPNNPVVLVVSTLVVAALAGRLRQRVQVLVDRRFYRRKYDANRIIAAFGAALQAELNLEQLRQNLLQVVTETMQPTHVSLWFVAVREKELRLKTSTAFDERVTDANRS